MYFIWLTVFLANPDPGQRPNVLIILTDQQQGGMFGAAGMKGIQTPAMDRIANTGVRFTRGFCTCPQCSPSRASLWTGKYPHQAGVDTNLGAIGSKGELPDDPATMARLFEEAGYETAYFGKWHLGKGPWRNGFRLGGDKGNDAKKAAEAAEYLQKAKKPFLCVVSFLNPHDIYHIRKVFRKGELNTKNISLPPNFHDQLGNKPPPQLRFLREDQGAEVLDFSESDWKEYIAYYRQLTEMVDGQIGQVLTALDAGGHADDTIVVFSSDHGDLAGAHGLPYKGPCMYEELIRVPFVISYPTKIPLAVRSELVINIDILPTLCSLTGIPVPKELQGRDLSPLLFGESTQWRDRIYGQYHSKQRWANPIRMVRTNRWKFSLYQAGYKELYDLQNDPGELKNLAGNPEFHQIQQELDQDLRRWIEETGDTFFEMTPTDRKGRKL